MSSAPATGSAKTIVERMPQTHFTVKPNKTNTDHTRLATQPELTHRRKTKINLQYQQDIV